MTAEEKLDVLIGEIQTKRNIAHLVYLEGCNPCSKTRMRAFGEVLDFIDGLNGKGAASVYEESGEAAADECEAHSEAMSRLADAGRQL